MSAEFEPLAEQIAELKEQELELEEMGLQPEELEEVRRDIRLQREELERELELEEEAQGELEEEIRRQRDELEREQQEARVREVMEMEMIANAEPRPPALTPLQQSLQRVYGTAFPELSTAELYEYLRLDSENMQEMEQGEERRMERQLERHARIEVRFLLKN
jgi:chromosome segregation ATPase